MVVPLYDFTARQPLPHRVPNEPIREFIDFILNGESWRSQPEVLFQRALNLRRELKEKATRIERVVKDTSKVRGQRPADK